MKDGLVFYNSIFKVLTYLPGYCIKLVTAGSEVPEYGFIFVRFILVNKTDQT